VTEHRLAADPEAWRRYGGTSFTVDHITYSKPWLTDRERVTLNKSLYPPEAEAAKRFLLRATEVIGRQLGVFNEVSALRLERVREGLSLLRASLA
jgi:hypothetical protein